jgi:hypothetical protein
MQNSCNTVYHRNMVCFRYIIVNTLRKGDNKDDGGGGSSSSSSSNNNNNNNRNIVF